MLTRRDMAVGLTAVALTATAFRVAGQAPVLGASIFQWSALSAKATDYGSVRGVINAHTATLDALNVHVTTLDAGKTNHPPVRQTNEELLVVKEGTLEVMMGGEWKRVDAGGVVFNASNQPHGTRNPGPGPAIYYVINWKTPATPAAVQP